MLAVAVVLTVSAVTVTYTGLPGPGPLHRYPLSDLQALADRVNGSVPGAASVDLLRSRVRIQDGVLACEDVLPVSPNARVLMPLTRAERRMVESSGPLLKGKHSCPIR